MGLDSLAKLIAQRQLNWTMNNVITHFHSWVVVPSHAIDMWLYIHVHAWNWYFYVAVKAKKQVIASLTEVIMGKANTTWKTHHSSAMVV